LHIIIESIYLCAAHDESGGELVTLDGKQYKQFYGMSSSVAMTKHSGGVAGDRFCQYSFISP